MVRYISFWGGILAFAPNAGSKSCFASFLQQVGCSVNHLILRPSCGLNHTKADGARKCRPQNGVISQLETEEDSGAGMPKW